MRVTERTQELSEQIVARDKALVELADAQKRLIELSRISGMAEVATGVLHNVGNVLNSVNVSATIVADHLRALRISQIGELVGVLEEHKSGLSDYLANDTRGQRVLPYMKNLSLHLEQERIMLGGEVASLVEHVGHIKEIVAMQQTYARSSGVFEKFALTDLLKDVLDIARQGMDRTTLLCTSRAMNCRSSIPTAQSATDSVEPDAKCHGCREGVRQSGPANRDHHVRVGEERVAIRVADNGIGILPTNLLRIFSHGFTTKQDGHGFGLHSGALAAQQLGGTLTVESEGTNAGATFTLELPSSAARLLEKRRLNDDRKQQLPAAHRG